MCKKPTRKIIKKIPVHVMCPSHYHTYFHQTMTTKKAGRSESQNFVAFSPLFIHNIKDLYKINKCELRMKEALSLIFKLQTICLFL